MSQDYYELLGCSRTSSADDLKKAFRKLAMQHHPDRNPGDKDAEKRFRDPLRERNIQISLYANAVRISPSIYNHEGDIQALVRVLCA